MKKMAVKKLNPVAVLAEIYLSRNFIENAIPVKADVLFINIDKLGEMSTIWHTLGNKELPGGKLYTVNHALHTIETYMVMKDYEKVMNFYNLYDPAILRSPLVLATMKNKRHYMILDGNHRACALWRIFKEDKSSFFIPVIIFQFKIKKEKKQCLIKS